MKAAFRQGIDVVSVVKGMTLEWTNEKYANTSDSIDQALLDAVQSGGLHTWPTDGYKPIHWSAAQLEPEKDPTENVDEFLRLVREKGNPEDLAVFTDRENSVVVIAHLELTNK